MSDKPKRDPVAETILEALAERGPDKSITPTEAAQAYAEKQWKPVEPPPGEWRTYLTAVRQQAIFLARQGEVEILRKGKPVDPEGPIKGVIRLALPSGEADQSSN